MSPRCLCNAARSWFSGAVALALVLGSNIALAAPSHDANSLTVADVAQVRCADIALKRGGTLLGTSRQHSRSRRPCRRSSVDQWAANLDVANGFSRLVSANRVAGGYLPLASGRKNTKDTCLDSRHRAAPRLSRSADSANDRRCSWSTGCFAEHQPIFPSCQTAAHQSVGGWWYRCHRRDDSRGDPQRRRRRPTRDALERPFSSWQACQNGQANFFSATAKLNDIL